MKKTTYSNVILGIVLLLFIFASCTKKYNGPLFPVKNLENKWGYIDTLGNELIKFQYDSACSFSEGYAIVKKDQNLSYINQLGEKQFDVKLGKNSPFLIRLIPKKVFLEDYNFYNGLALFYDETVGLYGYKNMKNHIVIKPGFVEAKRFSEDLAAVNIIIDSSKNEFSSIYKHKFGYINTKGEIVIQPQYDEAYSFEEGKSFVNFDSNDTFGKDGLMSIGWTGYYINNKGKFVSESLGFVNGSSFRNGFAIIQSINNKLMGYNSYYYVDSLFDHCPIINDKEFYFNEANRFSEGVATVCNGSKWFLINKKFELVIQNEFERIFRCSEGLLRINDQGKYGFINKAGALVIKCKFVNCSDFKNGLAYAELEDFNVFTWGYINRKGVFIWQLTKQKQNSNH